MERGTNRFLIGLANLTFWIHVFWVVYVIVGMFYKFPGVFWTLHFWMSVLILQGVILNECSLTTFERWIRRNSGQRKVANRGSRFLEVFYNITGIKLPNSLMRILGLVYFLLGAAVHFIR